MSSDSYHVFMPNQPASLSPSRLAQLLKPFCEKHHIRRLEVFGSVASGQNMPGSDTDLLVTLDDSVPTAALLEMAGEAEELIGTRVDFVFRPGIANLI